MKCDNTCVDLMPSNTLIQKLLERTTFFGIVISSEDDTAHTKEHKNFSISYNQQISPKELAEILLWAATEVAAAEITV